MSVEVRIPKEITDYKEKILLGMSIRQLICSVISGAIGIILFLLLKSIFGMNVTGYIVIIAVMPILAIGFIKPNGFTFERILKMMLKHFLIKSKRQYKTDLQLNFIGEVQSDVEFKKKRGKEEKRTRKLSESKKEYEGFESTKKGRKRRTKEAKKEIKRARKEFKSAKKKG